MQRLRFPFPASARAALTALLFLPLLSLAADPKAAIVAPPPPVPPAATREDLQKVADSIAPLQGRFDRQEISLTQIAKDLGTLAKRVEDDLKPDIAANTNTGVVALLKRIRDLQEAVGTEAQKREVEETDRHREALARLNQLGEQLAQDQRTTADLVDKLRADVAKARAPAVTAPALATERSPDVLIFATMLISAAGLGALLLWQARAQRIAADAARVEIINNLVQVRDALLPQRGPGSPGTQPAAEQRLAGLQQELQRLLAHLSPQPQTSVLSDDHTTRQIPPHLVEPHASTSSSALAPGSTSASASPAETALGSASIPPAAVGLPPEFASLDFPLKAWRAQLMSDLVAGSATLRAVVVAWHELQQVCAPPKPESLERIAGAVASLSERLYAYWDLKPELGEDDRARASSDWIKAVKTLTTAAAPKLDIREVIPGSRYDSDSMQTVQEGPGNHLNVAGVYSWVTLDRSGERVKVVNRARIATT